MRSIAQDYPLIPSRRDYILGYLKSRGGSWIRITDQELKDFGGVEFFTGCVVDRTRVETEVKVGRHGWDHNGRIMLTWRLTAPSGGWVPPTLMPWYGITTATNTTVTVTTHEGKTPVEHHIKRESLIEEVKKNQSSYADLRSQAQALYRDEIEKKTEEHIQGKIASSQIQVTDQKGQIAIPPDMSELFDRRLRALELDDREVIVLNDNEYSSYVEAGDINLASYTEILKRLEELS